MDGADGCLLQLLERLFEADARFVGRGRTALIELLPETNLQLAGGFVSERDRDDAVDRREPFARTFLMRAISSVVFPVPADASTMRLSPSECRMRWRAAASPWTGNGSPFTACSSIRRSSEIVLRFFPQALLFVGPADRPEIAQSQHACAGGRGGQFAAHDRRDR